VLAEPGDGAKPGPLDRGLEDKSFERDSQKFAFGSYPFVLPIFKGTIPSFLTSSFHVKG
jgi:hypothetical protein